MATVFSKFFRRAHAAQTDDDALGILAIQRVPGLVVDELPVLVRPVVHRVVSGGRQAPQDVLMAGAPPFFVLLF